MAWKVERQYSSNWEETREGATSEITFRVFNDEPGTMEQARAAFVAQVPSSRMRDLFGNGSARCRMEHEENSAGRCWFVTLSFDGDSKQEESLRGENAYWCDSFNTQGGSSHVTQGYKEKRYKYYDQAMLPDFEGRIGWNGESFEGVDIVSPTLELTYKQRYPYRAFLSGSIAMVAELTGSINKYSFLGFDAGNVLFCGANGTTAFEQEGEFTINDAGEPVSIPTPYWDVTFSFKVQPTRSIIIGGTEIGGVTIGGTTVTKRGWDYIWQLQDRIEDGRTGTTMERPRGIYVTQVYPEYDFGVFGIF